MRSISYLLLVLGTSLCAHQFPIIQFADIPRKPDTVAKFPRHRHVVWLDDISGHYYKVWPLDFKNNRYFEQAVACGFYDTDNTPLIGLIYFDTTCCGYVTKRMAYTSTECPGLILESFNIRRHTFDRIAPASMQNSAYQLLFNDLIERIKKYGLVFVDLNKKNIAWHEGNFFLIDLEYVLPLQEISKLFFDNEHLPTDYRNIIKALQANLPK